MFLAPVTNTLSKLVAKAQPFLLYQDLAEKGIIYLQQKISYPPLEILWECESMGLERSWRGRSTEQFYPSHHCSEPTQASYDSQPKNIINQSSLQPSSQEYKISALSAILTAPARTILMCLSQPVDSRLLSQWWSSSISGKHICLNCRDLNNIQFWDLSRWGWIFFQMLETFL